MRNAKFKIGLSLALLLCVGLVVVFAAYVNKITDPDGYMGTVQSGIEVLPWPKEMEKLFGGGDHFITHYGFPSESQVWNTEVFFYGKYTLTLQVNVSVSYWRHTIGTSVSAPKFYLHEVESVDISGQKLSTSFSTQWVIDEAQWNKLVKAKGDWSVLGIPVKTNSPVPGFDDYVRRLREPRENIPH